MSPEAHQYLFVCSVLFVHWVADFVAQTDKQAKAKAKDFDALFSHCAVYATIMTSAGALYPWVTASLNNLIVFGYSIFLSHITIDFVTSKLNAYLYGKGRVHDFFVSIGFDQWLHYVSIFGIILLLK